MTASRTQWRRRRLAVISRGFVSAAGVTQFVSALTGGAWTVALGRTRMTAVGALVVKGLTGAGVAAVVSAASRVGVGGDQVRRTY